MNSAEPHDAHVEAAKALFRASGFTLAAMQHKRCPEAIAGLKRFNGLPEGAKVPFAWGYFPNEHMRDNWRKYYGD